MSGRRVAEGLGSRFSDDGGSYTLGLGELDVSDATFATADLTPFARLDELGLVVTGQRIEPGRAALGSGRGAG